MRLGTPIAVICHEKELRKPSSSGVFAQRVIDGLQLMVRRDPAIVGHVEAQRRAGRTPVLLYPDEGAVPLSSLPGPLALYVAEGNWRQARKVGLREAPFPSITHASLPAVPPRRRLRRHPRADHLATMEAIGHAIRLVESEAHGEQILRTYDRFVDAVAQLRGWGDGHGPRRVPSDRATERACTDASTDSSPAGLEPGQGVTGQATDRRKGR